MDALKDVGGLFDRLVAAGARHVFQKKSDAEVTIRRVVDAAGEVIKTKENPNGVTAVLGTWVVEAGTGNWYTISPETMADRWQEVLNKPGRYSPRSVPTEMVELDGPVTIETKWGPMTGKLGDFLSRNNAGRYAIIDRATLAQTYEGTEDDAKVRIAEILAESMIPG